MIPYSLLDLVPVVQGGTIGEALANAAELAAHAEAHGYRRYWVAEHHGMNGVGSAAVSVVLAHVGHATHSIRIGAGGIMLPNHAPLMIAEQFGTLDALFPGRIDLGLGRAPGSDQRVMQALRRGLGSDPDAFPRDVMELQSYLADDGRTGIHAMPGAGAKPELWILGSSTFGAQLAALLGMPYAFASHFAPAQLDEAIYLYRHHFRPSPTLDKPHLMVAFNVFAADTDKEAEYLASSQQQAFVALRTGRAAQMPPPVRGYRASIGTYENAILDQVLTASAIGAKEKVAREIRAFVDRTQADELILTSAMYRLEDRKRSMTIAAEAMRSLEAPVANGADSQDRI